MSEQGHAPISKLNRLHKEYQARTLAARACYILQHQLFTPIDEELKLVRAKKTLDALDRKNPNKIGGRQAYNKAMIEEATRARQRGKEVPIDMGKKIIAGGGKLWTKMEESRKAQFRNDAMLLQAEASNKLEHDKAEAEEALARCRDRLASINEQRKTGMTTVSSCKFTASQVNEINHYLDDAKFKGQSLETLRAAATKPPEVDNATKEAVLVYQQKNDQVKRRPWWAKNASATRDTLTDSLWEFSVEGSEEEPLYGKFLFACQQPIVVVFLLLEAVASPASASCEIGDIDEDARACWSHRFRPVWPPMTFKSGDDALQEYTTVRILPDSVCVGGNLVVSDSTWEYSENVLPEVTAGDGSTHAGSKRDDKAWKEMVKAEPWLADLFHLDTTKPGSFDSSCMGGETAKASSSSGQVESDSPPQQEVKYECDPLDVPGVYEEMQRHREDWLGEEADKQDFFVSLVGGRRSKSKLGSAVEAFQGMVRKGGPAERFCRMFRAQMPLLLFK